MSIRIPSPIVCRGLDPGERSVYLEFACKAWGKNSPQASSSTLEWLYAANPNTYGIRRDLLVLIEENQVVGAHHRMRIPWRINGQRVVVPSLHDLSVLSDYRSGAGEKSLAPPGLQLMLGAFKDETHVAAFGTNDVAERIYDRMKVPCVEIYALQKIRKRLQTSIQMACARAGLSLTRRVPRIRKVQMVADCDVSVISNPTQDELAEALTITPTTQSYPDWDLASYRWRFFHELGPQNILLLVRQGGKLAGRGIVSIGSRKGIVVARVVEVVFQHHSCCDVLLSAIESTIVDLGAAVSLAVTGSQELFMRFQAAGWRRRKARIGARWYTRRGMAHPEDFWICGGAWDFGCDLRLGEWLE